MSTQSSVTDNTGRASTSLTLGNKVGAYTVLAASPDLANSPIQFAARAIPGAAVALVQTSGDGQSERINTTLANPFVVSVFDVGGNPVPDVAISFAVETIPVGATGQSLSVSSAITDSIGKASARLTLGNKVGPYRVTATSGTLTGSPVMFSATATVGAATTMGYVAGNNQAKKVGSKLDTALTVRITDLGGNPVEGVSVLFAFRSMPDGAAGNQLGADTTFTDSVGLASTFVVLGDKPGVYVVSASSADLTGSPILFTLQAIDSVVTTVTNETVPRKFGLKQNYPHPFNSMTIIPYTIADVKGGSIVATVEVFDVSGKKVKTLVSSEHEGGRSYIVVWDGKDDTGMRLASGTYFYRLVSGEYASSKKMIMLK